MADAAPLQITHAAHPGHELKLVATGGALFQCDGCRQYGIDKSKYRCEPCNFDLHVCCTPVGTHFVHPFFEGSTFAFLHRPPNVPGCDACGDPVLGFTFYDGERQLNLHPRCASLSERVVNEDSVLELCKEAPARGSCGLCGQGQDGRRGRFWCYRYQDDNGEPTYVHVACIMEASYSRGQAAQQGAPIRRRGKFRRFFKIALTLGKVTYSVANMDPAGVVTAFASLH